VRLLFRLTLLLAVILMPFGMTPVAASPSHHMMTAGMPMEHCPDQGSKHDHERGMIECMMGCAAALPASAARVEDPIPVTVAPIPPAPSHRLSGLHPDPATPPPRLA
jgi:hypothetical protein